MSCIWSSWYHCHLIISCSSKIQNGLPFLCRLTPVLEKRPLKGCSSCSSACHSTVLKNWWELKTMSSVTDNYPLTHSASSCLDPMPDSWRKGHSTPCRLFGEWQILCCEFTFIMFRICHGLLLLILSSCVSYFSKVTLQYTRSLKNSSIGNLSRLLILMCETFLLSTNSINILTECTQHNNT